MDKRASRFGLRKIGLLAATAFLALGLAWGISSSLAADTSSSPPAKKTTLRIGWTREPDNLNPFIGWENSSYEIWALNYSFLFGFGIDEKPTLDLASEWPTQENGGISADGKVWTIHLKPGVKWQDGQPLTASDVAWTYNFIVHESMANFTIMTYGIKEAKALDPTTVQIVCTRPKADMMALWIPILPEHVWKNVGAKAAQTNYVNKPPIIGSGPFQVVEVKKGVFVRMEANKGYFGGAPHFDEIIFTMYQNPDSMVADLQEGTIDAAWGFPRALMAPLKAAKGIEAIAYNYFNWDYLNFNCYTGAASKGNPVLKDAKFRTALNYAIDRESLCRIAFGTEAQPGTTIMTPNSWTDPDWHWQPPADQIYTFDIARAQQELADAGYKKVNGELLNKQGKPITLRLWALTESAEEQSEAKLMAGGFKQLGLKITLQVVDEGTLESHIWDYAGGAYAPDFDMYVWDWDGYNDPGQTLACETTVQIESTNESCWSNTEYDNLMNQQSQALDPTQRQQYIWKMQEVMYEQSPWEVLTYPDHFEAYNTDKWSGWARAMSGNGPAFYTASNITTYLNLRPNTGAGAKSSSGSVIVAIIVLAVIVVLAIVGFILWRRRSQAEEVAESS